MVNQNQSNEKFKFMIEAVNTANLYSTRSSSLSLTVNTNASDSTRSDILTLTELPNASWTSITSLILEMFISEGTITLEKNTPEVEIVIEA